MKVAEKQHATLGASNSKRWMNCAGSPRLIAQCPAPPSSPAALEGTAAHALAETCLRKGVMPDLYIGTVFESIVITEAMALYTEPYVWYCREMMAKFPYAIEQQFNLADLNPPVPMYGTADFVAYDAGTKTLHVVDFKSGSGVVVDPAGSSQLQYYALGASLTHPEWVPVTIVLTIVQPRAGGDAIRSAEISYGDLMEFTAALLQAAAATVPDDAPLSAGSWCRWCPASGVCPEQHKKGVELAQLTFSPITNKAVMPALTPSELLTPTEVARIMEVAPQVEQWLADVKAVVFSKLSAGEEVPGWKLVAKRAVRKWANETDTKQWLIAQGFDTEDIFEDPKMRSVAQVEKLVGKKQLPEDRVRKESSGVVLAPSSDPRPEVASLASVLLPPILESGEE